MNRDSKIYVAGHRGLAGSAITRALHSKGYENLIHRTSKELDLRNSQSVEQFFDENRPEYVFLAAATVGGIMANSTRKAEFIYDNLMIQCNVIHSAYKYGVKKLLFLGSSCIYPKHCPQPMKEEYLLTGELEPTNDAYAVAKIAGIKMCQSYRQQYGCDFIAAMPTNLYGPNDNYDLNTSHVLPALLRRFHEAKVNNNESVTLWGTGEVFREFLHSDDLGDACVFLINEYSGESIVNVGTGKELTIKELALKIKDVVGFTGDVLWDSSKPDGTPRKLLDVSKLDSLGWKASISLEEGLKQTYAKFVEEFTSQ
jgi:GDP-L-fucose synthase